MRKVSEVNGKGLPPSRRFGGQLPIGSIFVRKLLILGIVATVFSLFGLLVIVAFNSAGSGAEAAVERRASVLVPQTPIYRGMKIDRAAMKEVLWPEADLRDVTALTPNTPAETFYAKVDLPAEQPVILANLSKAPPANEIPTKLPPGHRAVTIGVDATSGVEGWSQAGTHVDVLVSYLDPEDKLQKSQIAVEDALVLSFNGMTEMMRRDTESETNGAVLPHVPQAATVTLAVPIQDALTIKTAIMLGSLSLVVRNPEDLSRASTKVVTRRDLLEKQPGFARAQLERPKPAPAPAAPLPPPPPVVMSAARAEKPKGFFRFTDPKTGLPTEMRLHNDGEWEMAERD